MSLCGTCSHVVKDGEGNPVSCHALVKYMPRDTCMFYELHRKYGSIKAVEGAEFARSNGSERMTERETITEINTIDGDKKLGGLDAWL